MLNVDNGAQPTLKELREQEQLALNHLIQDLQKHPLKMPDVLIQLFLSSVTMQSTLNACEDLFAELGITPERYSIAKRKSFERAHRQLSTAVENAPRIQVSNGNGRRN